MKQKVSCPYSLCNGDGVVHMGEFDNEYQKNCLCVKTR